jgi:autotransporter-associated beta strand protein
MKLRKPIFVLGALALLLATSASAQSPYNWTSTSDGSWNEDANWSGTGVPGSLATDNAIFNTASTVSTITLDGSRVLNSVSFGSANPSWTINPGTPSTSALSVAHGAVNFTVTNTTVNVNAALNAGLSVGTNELRTGGTGGTVNFTGDLGSRTILGSNTTVGTTGMIYNLNAANIAKSRLIVGFPNGTGGVNSVTGTTLNVNASQTSTNELRAGGGNNDTNAGVIVIRNAATWTQGGDSVLLGFSAGGGGGPSHGRLEVGVVGDSTGNLTIGNSANLIVADRAGTGILNINNGTVTVSQSPTDDTRSITLAGQAPNSPNPGATGTLNLNAGGTLVTARNFITSANGTGTFNFNGGLLQINRATGNVTTDLFSGTGITVNVQNGGARIDTQAHSTVINRDIVGVGNGGLEKLGAGTLTLNGANTFTGTTKVTGGTLALGSAGSIANSSTIIVGASTTLDVSAVTGGFSLGASQTLAGPGTVTGAMAVHGTLSPGNSPGTLTTGSQTWFNGGDFNLQIHDATGVAGTGFDTIAINGTLDLTNLSNLGFAINLWSLSASSPDLNGEALNFDNALAQSWTILTTSGGITGFDADDFAINTAANNGTTGFSNSLAGGSFALVQSGNNLQLNFAPVPEPRAALLGSLGMIALLRRRR